MQVESFLNQLEKMELDRDVARQSIYNYFCFLHDPTTQVSLELLRDFCKRALGFSFWQENWSYLSEQMTLVLAKLVDQGHMDQQLYQDLALDEFQALPVQSRAALSAFVEKHFAKDLGAGAHMRCLKIKDDQTLVLFLNEQGLELKLVGDHILLYRGEFEPGLSGRLSYDKNFNLKAGVVHELVVAPHRTAFFAANAERCSGRVLRGYSFQKFEDFGSLPLAQYPLVFYPLKQIELNFINQSSDPFYLELIKALENACELASDDDHLRRHPEYVKKLEGALNRGRLALEHIFCEDRLLKLLVSHIEKSLALRSVGQSRTGFGPSAQGEHSI